MKGMGQVAKQLHRQNYHLFPNVLPAKKSNQIHPPRIFFSLHVTCNTHRGSQSYRQLQVLPLRGKCHVSVDKC